MATTYLSRTYGTPTSTQKWTVSFWMKRGDLGREQHIFGGTSPAQCYFVSNDTLRFSDTTAGTNYYTNQVFRDTSAWYHFVIAVDTTLGTAGDRARIYVNGSEITSFSTETNATQNNNSAYNVSGTSYAIGRYNPSQASDYYFNGSYSHINFIDGTAYAPTAFGETNAASGIWTPIASPSVTYGNNGYSLEFGNSSALGTDSSGNSNTFTVNGPGTQTQDAPSNVFTTLNPLENFYAQSTFANGNTTLTTDNNYSFNTSTLGFSTGKYYWEAKIIATNYDIFGITGRTNPGGTTNELGHFADGWGFKSNGGDIRNNNTDTSYTSSFNTNGNIVQIAVDMTNLKLYLGVNGTWQVSSNPSTNTGGVTIGASSTTTDGLYFAGVGDYNNGSGVYQFNFGNGFFGTTAVASGNADGAGYGIFEYAPPTGYYSLCTKNINTYG